METKEQWYKAICRDPGNDQLRLVFCDWLDEQGIEDTINQAVFIRTEMELDERFPRMQNIGEILNSMTPEERGYWKGKGDSHFHFGQKMCPIWYPIPDSFTKVVRRGMIDSVNCTELDFIIHARQLFETNPITRVELRDKASHWNGRGHTWYNRERDRPSSRCSAENDLDIRLFYSLPKTKYYAEGRWSSWQTIREADQALSQACVKYGRELAGLPELDFESGLPDGN